MAHTLELRPTEARHRGEAPDAVVRLARGATQARQLRAGTCIAVQSGRVWLTQTGDANDYVIGAGERHVLARSGRVVLEGFAPQTTLRVLREAAAARPGFP